MFLITFFRYIETNPFPNITPPFSRHSMVDRDGNINTEDSNGSNIFNSKKMTKEEEEALMHKINQETKQINLQIQNQQKQFELQMQQFQDQMKQTFGNGFPFGNAGFPNFPYAQNFPFYYPTASSYNAPNYYPSSNYHNPYPYTPQAQSSRTDYYEDSDV